VAAVAKVMLPLPPLGTGPRTRWCNGSFNTMMKVGSRFGQVGVRQAKASFLGNQPHRFFSIPRAALESKAEGRGDAEFLKCSAKRFVRSIQQVVYKESRCAGMLKTKAVVGAMTAVAIQNQREPTRRTTGVASSPPSLFGVERDKREREQGKL
jgi:hypothetical protein